MRPLVTVIVPIYNNEKDIVVCVNSLLQQSYDNLQIILVDDGSTDESYEVCKGFQDSRITLLQKDNGGAASARNYGLTYAKGKYIYFLDSDDYLENTAIEKLVCVAEKAKADCVIFEGHNYTEEKDLKVKKDGLSLKTAYAAMSGRMLLPQLLQNKDFHASPVLYFVHRQAYENGLEFEEGIMFEDELFSFQLLEKCKNVVCFREKLYNRKVRSGSVMTSKGKGMFRFDSISRVFDKLFEMYTEKSSDEVIKKYIVRISLLWYSYWKQLTREEKEKKSDKYAEIRERILKSQGFGSRELIVRCYGYYLWMIYILPNRCFRKIRLRSLR